MIADRLAQQSIKDALIPIKKRIIDLSYGAARALGALKKGVVPVHVESLPEESQEFANIIHTIQCKEKKKRVHFIKAFHKYYT